MGGNRFSLLGGVDPNPNNVSRALISGTNADDQLVVAGVLHMSSGGKV